MPTTSYPDSEYTHTPEVDGVSDMDAEDVNRPGREIAAVTSELGALPKGLYYANVAALLLAVARQLEAAEQTTPNLTLQVQAGNVYVDGTTLVEFAGGNSPSFTAPTSNPRIDLLVLNSSGTLERIVGSEAASPSPPTYPTDKLPIVEVHNRVGQTSIKNTDDASNGYILKDIRPFLNLGVAGASSIIDQERLWGCNIKPNTTTKIDVETGVVEVDTIAGGSPEVIEVSSALTMDFATTGANGLDTGTPGIGFYHIFAIYNPTTQINASLASQNDTSPTLPSGYTKLRRVGTFYNTAAGSASIRAFKQAGKGVERRYQWNAAVTVLAAGSATSYTSVSLSTAIPSTAHVVLGYWAGNFAGSNLEFRLSHDGTDDTLIGGGAAPYTGLKPGGGYSIILTTTQQFWYKKINDAVDIFVNGYVEAL